MKGLTCLGVVALCACVAACGSNDEDTSSTWTTSSGSAATSGGGGDASGSTATTTTSTGSGDGPADAKAFFMKEVHPTLLDSCGNCHITGPGLSFLADDAANAYDKARSAPGIVLEAKSRLLLKGEHSGGEAPALTSTQADVVTQWLALEFADGGGDDPPGGDPPALTPLQQMQAFGNGMSYADWEKYQLVNLANEQVIYQNNAVPCLSCHGTGQSGAYISDDSIEFFEASKKMPYLFKFANATLTVDGTFDDVVNANRFVEKCVENPMVGNPHPPCVNGQIDTQLIQNLQSFFEDTKKRWAAGKCDEATDPPEAQ